MICGVCVENGIRKKFLFFVTVGRALLCENKQKTTKKLERICIQESNETKRNDGRVGRPVGLVERLERKKGSMSSMMEIDGIIG